MKLDIKNFLKGLKNIKTSTAIKRQVADTCCVSLGYVRGGRKEQLSLGTFLVGKRIFQILEEINKDETAFGKGNIFI